MEVQRRGNRSQTVREDRWHGGERAWLEYTEVIGREFFVMGKGYAEIQRQEIKDSKQAQRLRADLVSCTDTWFQTCLIGCFPVFLRFAFAHPSLPRNDLSSPSIGTFTHLLNSMTLIDTPMSPHKTNLLKRVQDLLAIFSPSLGFVLPTPGLFSTIVLFLWNTVGLICFCVHAVQSFFLLSFFFLTWEWLLYNVVLFSAIHHMNQPQVYTGLLPPRPPSHLPPHPTTLGGHRALSWPRWVTQYIPTCYLLYIW